MCVCMCLVGGALNPAWLRPNRTEALTVTDKRQAPSVKSTWHRASFSLADAKSMTEGLAGGQAGRRPPLLARSSAGLEIQRQASSIRESLFMMMMTISHCLHSPCYLNPSLSCLLPAPLRRCLSRVLLIFLPPRFFFARSLRKPVSNVCITEKLSSEKKKEKEMNVEQNKKKNLF